MTTIVLISEANYGEGGSFVVAGRKKRCRRNCAIIYVTTRTLHRPCDGREDWNDAYMFEIRTHILDRRTTPIFCVSLDVFTVKPKLWNFQPTAALPRPAEFRIFQISDVLELLFAIVPMYPTLISEDLLDIVCARIVEYTPYMRAVEIENATAINAANL
jgi:hypothetical protein